jgi:hypothetical protein
MYEDPWSPNGDSKAFLQVRSGDFRRLRRRHRPVSEPAWDTAGYETASWHRKFPVPYRPDRDEDYDGLDEDYYDLDAG